MPRSSMQMNKYHVRKSSAEEESQKVNQLTNTSLKKKKTRKIERIERKMLVGNQNQYNKGPILGGKITVTKIKA